MRATSLLITTLLLAVPVFGQQASTVNSTPAQSATATVDQPPAHPITPAQVHEILELTGARRLQLQTMRAMMASLRKAFPPYMPEDVIDDLESNMEKVDLEPMAVEAYQKHVSTEDAAKMIAFYKTPAGGRLIAVLPQIAKEMQMSGEQSGVRIAQQIIMQHSEEIKAAAAKYRQEHSDTPKITSPN
ncbi:MAG: DUF2059 domain-containing protein [Acidobacteriaceae bacterium]